MLEDCYLTSALARTRLLPWGLGGGRPGRPNGLIVEYPDGDAASYDLRTRIAIPKDAVVHLRTGSGGGYGDPAERRPEQVRTDLADGYITREHAQRWYAHALD
jgi:N-methylhydantoinase B